MEYAKLFYSGRYPAPPKHLDMIILFKEYLQKIWWKTSTPEEKAEWHLKEEKKKRGYERAMMGAAMLSSLPEFGFEATEFKPSTDSSCRSKFW